MKQRIDSMAMHPTIHLYIMTQKIHMSEINIDCYIDKMLKTK